MPKKVITRRQRKAAEAKRQSESNARATAASEALSGNAAATAAATAPSTSDAVKPAGTTGAKVDSKNSSNKTTNTKTAVPQQKQEAENMPEQSTDQATVTVIVKDKTTQSDNNVFDLLADENIQKQVGHTAECQAQLPAAAVPPANEQAGSFSKTLTRRAVATFTKLQKISKVFNKKMNYKTPPANVTEPMNLANVELDETVKTALNGPPGSDIANKTCSCDFCKAVLNQLLAGKKRANDKKGCKNANRRPNVMRSTSPGRINGNETGGATLPAEAKYEDENKTTQTPSIASKRRIIQMLEKKEKLLEKDVRKKQLNQQNTKISATEQQIKKPDVKEVDQKGSNPVVAKTQPTPAPVDGKQKPMPKVEAAKASPTVNQKATEPVKTPKTVEKPKQPAKVDISTVVKQLSAAPIDAPPPEVIGNTGYFILTGTDAQLAAQFSNLAARNVRIENCVELLPGAGDKIEQQLRQLSQTREEIQQRMSDKHDMMAKRRTKRSKEPSKYT